MRNFIRRESGKREDPAREGMKQFGKVKRPKDYVVLMGNRLIDGRRVFTFEFGLPSELPPGMSLAYHTEDGKHLIVHVEHDYGADVRVTMTLDGGAEESRMVPRAKLALIPFPSKPTLVHKKDLHKYIGPKAAATFWDSKLRLRVPPSNPKQSKPPKP